MSPWKKHTQDWRWTIMWFIWISNMSIWCLLAFLRHKLGQPRLQHWIGWLDFKDGRPTRSIDSTFADSFDSTRLQRQTIDSIERLDRFRGLALMGNFCPKTKFQDKKTPFRINLGANYIFWAPIMSSVGKLQLSAPPTSLNSWRCWTATV